MMLLFFSYFVLLSTMIKAQYIAVTGYLTNFVTGEAIENATVFESHSDIGTISNREGFYQLILHPGELNILFSGD